MWESGVWGGINQSRMPHLALSRSAISLAALGSFAATPLRGGKGKIDRQKEIRPLCRGGPAALRLENLTVCAGIRDHGKNSPRSCSDDMHSPSPAATTPAALSAVLTDRGEETRELGATAAEMPMPKKGNKHWRHSLASGVGLFRVCSAAAYTSANCESL